MPETTIGAVSVSPASVRTPLTRPSATRISVDLGAQPNFAAVALQHARTDAR